MKTLAVFCAVLAYASAGVISGVVPWTGAPIAYGGGLLSWAGASPLVNGLTWARAAPVAAGVPLVYAPLWEKSQYHSQDELGQAAFGHAQPGQVHNAVRDAAGNVAGSYSYVDPNGKVVVTDYTAGVLGVRVASNALPVGPSEGPAPVQDTPEVIAARTAHLAAVETAKASKALPQVAAIVPAPVQDTPEVVAARAAHLAEVEAARSRNKRGVLTVNSIAAPLTYSITSPAAAPIWSVPSIIQRDAIVSPLALGAPVIAAPSTLVREGILTTIVNTPGHAQSYRVD